MTTTPFTWRGRSRTDTPEAGSPVLQAELVHPEQPLYGGQWGHGEQNPAGGDYQRLYGRPPLDHAKTRRRLEAAERWEDEGGALARPRCEATRPKRGAGTPERPAA